MTVGQIAKRAGMSTALAHYYFETKDAIFLAAMRHILTEFGQLVRAGIAKSDRPIVRLNAIIDASLSREQFAEEIVAAWLVFYVQAQRSAEASRLLRVYARRLHSNLVHDLKALVPGQRAHDIAEGMASMIDGIYIRHALQGVAPSRLEARELVRDYLRLTLAENGVSLQVAH